MCVNNAGHLSGKRSCLPIAGPDANDPAGHFGYHPCKKIKTKPLIQQIQGHDRNQQATRSVKALCLERTSCLRRDFPADAHTLQRKINAIIKPGNLTDCLPQNEHWTPYDETLNQRLKRHGLSREQYNIWQKKAQELNLEADPVITELNDQALSDHMLELQARFLEQGRETFACKEFHIVVRNMQRCLAPELLKRTGTTRSELEKLNTDLAACQQTAEIPFRELLPLVIRFIVTSFVLYKLDDSRTTSLADSSRDDSEDDVLTTESVTELLQKFNTITIEKLIDDPLLPATITNEILGNGLIYDSDLASLKCYLDDKYPYLPWFCFDELPAEFFMRAVRYRICAVGLLATPLANADHCLMDSVAHPLHDMTHARACLTQLPPDEQAYHYQQVLETMEAALKQIDADTETAYAIRFALSYCVHDSFGRGKPFEGVPGINNMMEEIIKRSRWGEFLLPVGVREAHFIAAEQFWSFWYPEPSPFTVGR